MRESKISKSPPHKLCAIRRSGSIRCNLLMKVSSICLSFWNIVMFESFFYFTFQFMSNGKGHESNFRTSEKLWNLSSFVGPSWFNQFCTRHDIMAISFVLCWDLAVLAENVSETSGGLGLFRSSTVALMNFGLSTQISCLHQVFLKSVIFFAFLMVNQQGPLIFCFKINSSSILWLAPNKHSNVLPVRLAGN